jgi:hypothetical protein
MDNEEEDSREAEENEGSDSLSNKEQEHLRSIKNLYIDSRLMSFSPN